MLLIMLVSNEVRVLATSSLPAAGVAALLLSCVGGLGMSYFSFALRAVISATSFSVIGNICKVLTILVNILMWDQHASEHLSLKSIGLDSKIPKPYSVTPTPCGPILGRIQDCPPRAALAEGSNMEQTAMLCLACNPCALMSRTG